MRLTLSGIIENEGYDVTAAEDGYQAIDAAGQTAFDLIFLDIKMPGINGVQTFREIKRISPASMVVMMTGYAVEDLVRDALEEGAFSVIYKPFAIEKIIELIELALKTVLILVVDDHAPDRLVLNEILKDKGYGVAEAADGEQAIRMVREKQYDIILMDIKLPGRDGLATFQEIKAIDPDARVIFITGFVLEDSIKEALEGDAYPVAYKPFDMEDVMDLVKHMVAERSR